MTDTALDRARRDLEAHCSCDVMIGWTCNIHSAIARLEAAARLAGQVAALTWVADELAPDTGLSVVRDERDRLRREVENRA